MNAEQNGDNVTIADLYNLIKNTQLQNYTLHKEGREEIKEEIIKLKTEITRELNELKQENENLKEENSKLKNRLLASERKLKKYNLIVYGVDCAIENTLEAVLRIINEHLNIRWCNESNIRDVYHIGNKIEGKTCPILIEFTNYKLKTTILSNAKKLKGTGIFVSNDYIPEDYEKRKVLNKHLRLAREKHLSARIKNNKLVVNGEDYSYETLKNQEVDEEIIPNNLDSGTTSKEEKKITSQSTSTPSTPTQTNTFSLPPTQNDNKKRKQVESPTKETKSKRERSCARKQVTKK